MIQKLSDFFIKIAGWKTFLVALVIYLFFGAYVMPTGAKQFEQICRRKVQILDLQLSYSPDKAKAILDDYNDAGRAFAVKFGLIADTFYPLAYTFFFLIVTSLIFKGLSGYGIKTGTLHLFPLLILPIDYLENLSIVNLMTSYPNLSNTAILVSSFFTSLKWGLVAILAFITIGGLIMLGIKRFSKAN